MSLAGICGTGMGIGLCTLDPQQVSIGSVRGLPSDGRGLSVKVTNLMTHGHIGGADPRGRPQPGTAAPQPRRGRSWRRGMSDVSSVATSIGFAPSDFSNAKTSSRSSWHNSTMTRGLPVASASSARRAAVSDS